MSKNLKNKIKSAFKEETPDLKSKILYALESEEQLLPEKNIPVNKKSRSRTPIYRRIFASILTCFVLFCTGIFVGKLLPNSSVGDTETYVYLDVNPSLVLTLNKEKIVLSSKPLNADAEKVLQGLNLEGVELETALNAIVGSMYVKGYLTMSDNSMLISIDTQNPDDTPSLLNFVTDKVNDVFANSEMQCAIIAQGFDANDELKQRAEAHGISVGKMHLLDKMVENIDGFSHSDVDTLSRMPIKDLHLIYQNHTPNDDRPESEFITGEAHAQLSKDQALQLALSTLNLQKDDVENYELRIKPSSHGTPNAVYHISLTLKDGSHYSCEIDCHTGAIFSPPAPPAP